MAPHLVVGRVLPVVLCTVILLAMSALSQEPSGRLELHLRANKARYICGEPIVLRTTMANPSQAHFTSRRPTIRWDSRDGYSLDIALGEESEFRRLWDLEVVRNIKPSPRPIEYDFYTERHWVPGTIEAGQRYERTDLLVLPKPGRYRVRASIVEEKEFRFVSSPVSVEVLPLAEVPDSIAKLGDRVFALRLGRALVEAHYAQRIMGSTGPDGSLGRKAFDDVAATIIEQHRGSAFRETVMYADIIDGLGADHLEREAALERSKALGRQFIREYPQSLLLPDVYYTLFRCHVQQKEPEKAAAVRAEALPKFPNATVLRTVREFDLDKIRQPQQGAEAPPSRGKGVTVVKPRTEDKSEEGDAPAKKDSPEKGD